MIRGWWLLCPCCGGGDDIWWRGVLLTCLGCGATWKDSRDQARGREDAGAGRMS